MKAIVIGGFGRSGTSLLRNWFINNPNSVSFGKTESKFFVEPYGLTDLFRAFVSDFSHSRASIAIEEFSIMMRNHLIDPAFTGQPSITAPLGPQQTTAYFGAVDAYIGSLQKERVPVYMSESEFFTITRAFIEDLVSLYTNADLEKVALVEKTPHNSLNPLIFTKLFDPLKFVWVIRDPRAVVYSTTKMDWGLKELPRCIVYVKQLIIRYLQMRSIYGGYEVRLESLATDISIVLDRLSEYCEFYVNPGLEAYDEQVVSNWKSMLHPDELILIEDGLRDEIRALGY